MTPTFYRECIERIDYSGLPAHYGYAMRNCIERGCSPGDAILLVLENNLTAILCFDDPQTLFQVFRWVNNVLPLPIWGSPRKVRAWMTLARAQSRRTNRCKSGRPLHDAC